jgi:ubiquinone/menaquinone biosynthesis C-methylase UbiE
MPEEGSPWASPDTVAGFARSPPNGVLMRYADAERARLGDGFAADIGCGAGRNAVPLARGSWNVLGTDLSWPMLAAAIERSRAEPLSGRVMFVHAPMETIPARDASMDLVIAHGIWNLAGSSTQFRLAIAEAARVAKAGAALFVFTFSRHTLPAAAQPVAGELFVYTQFSGRPQIFLTDDQLVSELRAAGFDPDPAVPLTEYNRRAPGALNTGSGPVIYEAAFRRRG